MENFKGKERREYKRIKKHFIAKFRVEHKGEPTSGSWEMVTVENLGAGGVLFNYDKKIEVGSLLDLKINFPGLKDPIECEGKVVRIEEMPHPCLFRIATVFIKLDEGQRGIINKVAEAFFVKSPEKID